MNEQVSKLISALKWLPTYSWQQLTRDFTSTSHVVIALADHFEPAILPDTPTVAAELSEQERRLDHWCREYPKIFSNYRDHDGRPFCHTYFYPAEQYHRVLLERLAEHCQAGWGEIEIHLHHGIAKPDTALNTREALIRFRDQLAEVHGCLSRWEEQGVPQYGFVHGNWALANSADNRFCGVDEEMKILSETGCYADFTLPSFPSRAQVSKINAIYECGLPLDQRSPHRKGIPLRKSVMPRVFPLIVQGPLGLNFDPGAGRFPLPFFENSAITSRYPATMHRFKLWCKAAISVIGRPDWIFIKLHCHGMDPRDYEAMLGSSIQKFLKELTQTSKENGKPKLHFVSAREMVNILLAACEGREGNPREFRDYKLRLITKTGGV